MASPAIRTIPWRQLQKFAESVALGKSATQAYLDARPNVAYSTAKTNGAELAKQPRAQMVIASMRAALVDRATEDFIMNREEVMRWHTLAALTPVGEIDETHFLAQEVTYRITTTKAGDVTESKTIRMVNKTDSVKELTKIRGDYKPEKLEISDTSTRDKAIDAFADDPLFAQLLQDEARIQAAKLVRSGAVIEMEPAPPIKTLEDLEEQQRLDDEAEELY